MNKYSGNLLFPIQEPLENLKAIDFEAEPYGYRLVFYLIQRLEIAEGRVKMLRRDYGK